MPYTVWSRGRLIGETDLGFRPLIESLRSGWFHPSPEGERLMPMVASVTPAMRAYLHRDKVDASGNGFVQPELEGSTLFADLAEAFQHLLSFELELRREDGSVVPTSDIGLQDTHQLIAFAEEAAAEDGEEESAALEGLEVGDHPTDWLEDVELFDTDPMRGGEAVEDAIGGWADDISTATWAPEEFDQPEFPRYQIHVQLLRGDAIP
jgi:hypothetical protein